ncbi:hypothetical protein FNV43_RR16856 [Rhamnella rubrinervis]|uniref:Uncharacterized protein n=1 Tax=Rhamnella rubrinervis TaxID=2594499 RepID=A0A8K0GZP5_9ROSA|nr:hypothetical protein FNV43_RR16856 [Rhamnella rubrinervis]
MALVQPKDLTIAIPVEKSLHRRGEARAPARTKKRRLLAPKQARGSKHLVASEPNQVTKIVDGLMTQHDRVILKRLTFEDISHKDEDEPEKNIEAEKTPSLTRDSFMEAMNAVRAEETEPIANTREVSSAAQPNRGDLP